MSFVALLVLTSAFLPSPGRAGGLAQINPARQAPFIVNDPGTVGSMDHNEYPWFSRDGKLFFWTRQENPTPGTQWLWVSYFKNRNAVANAPAGTVLPALSLSTPVEMHDLNHHFLDHHPGEEIKALAFCQETNPPQPEDLGNRKRYRFTLYLAVGPPTERKQLYRAHRIVVVVRKSDQEITSVQVLGGISEAVPQTIRPTTGGIANETEPYMTENGKYLFWASNAWGGTGRVSHFIGPLSACTQLQQTPRPFNDLPVGRFAWKDQYTTGPLHQRTSRTNYHSLISRQDAKTALIFEQCRGQTGCVPGQAGNRQCECETQDDSLSTTGFDAGGRPTPIANFPVSPLNPVGGRASHPAVSGNQNPDGSWLLFYMRGKKIWYTKIAEASTRSLPPKELSVAVHADADIAQSGPAANFGSAGGLRVRHGATGAGRHSFLRFVVPAIDGKIERAQLRIRTRGAKIPEAAVYRIDGLDWTEGGVTWKTWDSGGASSTLLRRSEELSAERWHRIDVSEAVSADGGIVTLGLASSSDLPGLEFYSSETAFPPSLEIAYRP